MGFFNFLHQDRDLGELVLQHAPIAIQRRVESRRPDIDKAFKRFDDVVDIHERISDRLRGRHAAHKCGPLRRGAPLGVKNARTALVQVVGVENQVIEAATIDIADYPLELTNQILQVCRIRETIARAEPCGQPSRAIGNLPQPGDLTLPLRQPLRRISSSRVTSSSIMQPPLLR